MTDRFGSLSLAPRLRNSSNAACLAVIGLVTLASWGLSHSYHGIVHDARLYALQGLAHLDPLSLGQDVFLKFGSQDRFTVFGPIFAAASRALGIETTAALFTLLSQIALLASAWLLARTTLQSAMAFLGLAVFIAIPGNYGADRVFTCIEPFMTPRMPAEALVLLAIAAGLNRRPSLCSVLVIAALLVHPIMALAGVFALYCYYVGLARPLLSLLLGVLGLVALALLAYAMPLSPWGILDISWLTLVENRSPFLFLTRWHEADWCSASVSIASLLAASEVLSNRHAQALSRMTLVAVLSGFFITLIACDLLHLTLITQLQPWRWQWLGTVVAAVLLPELLRTLWQREVPGRATALLLAAAWIFASNTYAFAAAALALAALLFAPKLKPNEVRWVFYGACAMLAVALSWRLACNLQFTDSHYFDTRIPLWLRRSMSFARDGTAPLAIIAVALWLTRRQRRPVAVLFLAGLSAAGCAAILPYTWRDWTTQEYSGDRVARFASFRAMIPVTDEVFWPESPQSTWMLLGRPNYLSMVQTSGVVFSRASAMELQHRATALKLAIDPGTFMGWGVGGGAGMNLSQQQLTIACNTGEFKFLVTGANLAAQPEAATPSGSGPANKIRLYRCPLGS